MSCPVCAHANILHDGDGTDDDPYRCTIEGCRCAYVVSDGRPEIVVMED